MGSGADGTSTPVGEGRGQCSPHFPMSAKPSLTTTPLGGELAPHTQESHIGAKTHGAVCRQVYSTALELLVSDRKHQASSDLGANVFGHVDPKDV